MLFPLKLKRRRGIFIFFHFFFAKKKNTTYLCGVQNLTSGMKTADTKSAFFMPET